MGAPVGGSRTVCMGIVMSVKEEGMGAGKKHTMWGEGRGRGGEGRGGRGGGGGGWLHTFFCGFSLPKEGAFSVCVDVSPFATLDTLHIAYLYTKWLVT